MSENLHRNSKEQHKQNNFETNKVRTTTKRNYTSLSDFLQSYSKQDSAGKTCRQINIIQVQAIDLGQLTLNKGAEAILWEKNRLFNK